MSFLSYNKRIIDASKRVIKNYPFYRNENLSCRVHNCVSLNWRICKMDWWYQQDGNVIGPCSEEKMEQLLKNNELAPETLVRNEEMENWQPVSKAYRSGKPLFEAGKGPKTRVFFLWCMVLAPALTGFMNTILLPRPPVFSFNVAVTILVYGILFYGFCILQDMRLLEKQQYPTKKWWLLLVLCPPAYLFVRAHQTDKKYLPAIVDCISISLFNLLAFFRSVKWF